MNETVNQSADGATIVRMAVADIQPSAYNPRKRFDEESLKELADSIRQKGVLQPINVRHIPNSDKYEIVFGERRYRASQIAGLEEIPATISDYTDAEAEEIAITENLQRKDVTPMEEADAYQRLIDSGRHDVGTLAILFGKSEGYIRSRLKFTALIPEIAELMESETISIAFANEICRYGEDIQREVYEQHLKNENGYGCWRGMKASDVARAIEQNYTTDLEKYDFDKDVCAICPHNTNHLLLFSEGGCGKCTNRKCLDDKIASHMVDKVVKTVGENPNISICHTAYNTNGEVIGRLADMGYEVDTVDYVSPYPTAPEMPRAEDYEDTAEFEEDLKGYGEEKATHEALCVKLDEMRKVGEITVYIQIRATNVCLCYATNKEGAKTDAKKLSPIEEIDKKDERNREIAVEKTIADTKKKILEVDMTATKFSADEERMMYFFMLSALRKEHYIEVGLPEEKIGYLSDEDRLTIVNNLSAKTKAIIRRDYLIENFKNAYRGNATASMLHDFAKKHMPDELTEIENGYNEVYNKRHQRLEEKKALLIKEQQSEETPQEMEEPAAEDMTAVEMQAEETAA